LEDIIAYCGINCSKCPAYVATQNNDIKAIKELSKKWSTETMIFKPKDIYCDGCNAETRIFYWCTQCNIRICCKEKEIENCAYCDKFVCDTLKNSYERNPEAKQTLDNIRKGL